MAMKQMTTFVIFLAFVLLPGSSAWTQDFTQLVNAVKGAKIIAQDDDNTYLGKIANEYDSESIFNEYGAYGNEYRTESIWNTYGSFGSAYAQYSPHNKYTSTPPMIIRNGKIVGYLTVNSLITGSINPNLLKAIKDQF